MASLLQPQPLQHPAHPTHLQGLPSPGGRSPQSSMNTFTSSSSPASFASSGPPTVPLPRNTIKSGWLEKYSVGRGFLPLRNWRRRWVSVTHSGLNYSPAPAKEPPARTFVPFVEASGRGDTPTKHRDGVKLRPVFLYSNVTASVHSEACNPHMFYFGLRFEEEETPRILLFRTQDQSERDSWVRFVGQFVHAAGAGMPFSSHPVSARKNPKNPDPEELDPQSQAQLRRSVLAWDDGFHHRVAGFEAPTENAVPVNWESDEEEAAPGDFEAEHVAENGNGRLERRKSSNSRAEGASSRPPPPGDDDTL